MKEIKEKLASGKYDEAKALIKSKLQANSDDTPENGELYYLRFLASNDNYFITDDEYNDEMGFQKAVSIASFKNKCLYEAEYSLYKAFPEIQYFAEAIRSIQVHDYNKFKTYFKSVDNAKFGGNVVIKERFMQSLDYIVSISDIKKEAALYFAVLKALNLKSLNNEFDDVLDGLKNHMDNMGALSFDIEAATSVSKVLECVEKVLSYKDAKADSVAVTTEQGASVSDVERYLNKLTFESGNKAVYQVQNSLELLCADSFVEYENSKSANPNLLARYYYKKFMLTGDVSLKAKVFNYVLEAEKTNPDGEIYFYLAKCYKSEIGVRENPNKVLEYYKKSAQLNNSAAINNLAVIFHKGYGAAPMSKENAFKMFVRSMELGNITGIYNVGICYKSGTGTAKNLTKAIEYLEMAAKERYTPAVELLVKYYVNPQTYNKTKYEQWFEVLKEIRKEEQAYTKVKGK